VRACAKEGQIIPIPHSSVRSYLVRIIYRLGGTRGWAHRHTVGRELEDLSGSEETTACPLSASVVSIKLFPLPNRRGQLQTGGNKSKLPGTIRNRWEELQTGENNSKPAGASPNRWEEVKTGGRNF
jgi:hypothetical protein